MQTRSSVVVLVVTIVLVLGIPVSIFSVAIFSKIHWQNAGVSEVSGEIGRRGVKWTVKFAPTDPQHRPVAIAPERKKGVAAGQPSSKEKSSRPKKIVSKRASASRCAKGRL